MDMNLSFSVLTADIISILLIGTLYLANRQKAEYDRDMRLLQQMMVTIGIANISDCCVYYLAGSSNIVIKVLVFLSGSGLFLGNVMIGYLWAKFIMVHMNIPFSDFCCFLHFGQLVFVCDVPEKSWYAQAVSDTGISCCGCDCRRDDSIEK